MRDGEEQALRPFIFLSFLLSIALSLFLAACTASTQPVVKIGLVAPFEGRYRPIGYEAIYAARLAIREINARGGINGHRIELVALDDRGEPEQAITAARQLVLDPQVVAVIGHLRPDSSDAAMKIYCEAGLPVIAIESAASPCEGAYVLGSAPRDRWPEDQLIFVSNVPDPNGLAAAQEFVKNYNAIPIDGTRAGPIALQTYDVMNLLFAAFAQAEKIDRNGVQATLRTIDFSGLGAKYKFDQQGNLIDPQTYVFEYDRDQHPQLIP
ncbi:MAG TPA: ABC transporter substrate-binding protein [Anaerolineae bacterium]|nr:ABC transporter substrate-binding protein [Anaerolineae bacterium]